MLKQILLLTPVYVTLFWSITLNTSSRNYYYPRLFLGKFMLFAFVVYLSHFFYFFNLQDVYTYIDPFYQYASLMVFPMYHIYFRMLTIDNVFSFRKHFRFLIAPTLLFLLYLIGAVIMGFDNFKSWNFNKDINPELTGVSYLNLIHLLIRIVFLIQVIGTLIGNFLLIKKYGEKANQYYSNMEDSRTNKVKFLNFSMIVTGLASLVLGALGRNFFNDEITGIAIASVVFSTMLFIIGWLGDKQKPLNPYFEMSASDMETVPSIDLTKVAQLKMLEKIMILFQENKIYMDNSLTIQDIAQTVGTNRTYISSLINQQFNQNFCTFVNNFRVDELENVVKKHPDYNNQVLAESCGFGSVDSMKRAVSANTNKSFQEWKKEVIHSEKV